jgi:hypothetical protein
MIESFRMGGWGMYPTALFGLLLLAVAARYALKPDNRWVPLQIALSVLTLTTAMLGFVTGLIATTTNLSGAPPAKVWTIAAAGFGESLVNVGFALAFIAIAALAISAGAARVPTQAAGVSPRP